MRAAINLEGSQKSKLKDASIDDFFTKCGPKTRPWVGPGCSSIICRYHINGKTHHNRTANVVDVDAMEIDAPTNSGEFNRSPPLTITRLLRSLASNLPETVATGTPQDEIAIFSSDPHDAVVVWGDPWPGAVGEIY
jgi:hypothetical protein